MKENAPTATGEPAQELQTRPFRKPPLPALTGLRTLLALTILMYHFTPAGLMWPRHPWVSLYPVINIGYVFVSFFFLISGFILSYNYIHRTETMNKVDFWMARLSRLYPVYALTLLISIPMLLSEFSTRPRAQFIAGVIATPLLMQGFLPTVATFWNTVSWTLSCEVMLYIAFPWLLRLRWPSGWKTLLVLLIALWLLGLVPHAIYMVTDPDHLGHAADRFSGGFWIDTLKYTPLPYLCTFLAGLTLGRLHESVRWTTRTRVTVGLAGFAVAALVCYGIAERIPYVLVHGGLLTPMFAAIIVGLAGPSPLARVFSWKPLVAVGTSTYALYLMHFNVIVLLHNYHVWDALHVTWLDPWISYVFVVLLAVSVRRWVEHPAQLAIGNWWKRRRTAKRNRRLLAI